MSDYIKKEILETIVCDIKVLDLNLEYWLSGEGYINSSLPENLYYKYDFVNFSFNDIPILTDEEIKELINLDKQVSTNTLSLEFEKNILVKRKSCAIRNLDLTSIVETSKKTKDIDSKIDAIKKDVVKHVNKYADLTIRRLSVYNDFVNDIDKCKSIKQLHKKKDYNSLIVGYYRFNKICDFIISAYVNNNFDLNDFFDRLYIKNLLKCDYLRVKQKVGAYVGANN